MSTPMAVPRLVPGARGQRAAGWSGRNGPLRAALWPVSWLLPVPVPSVRGPGWLGITRPNSVQLPIGRDRPRPDQLQAFRFGQRDVVKDPGGCGPDPNRFQAV